MANRKPLKRQKREQLARDYLRVWTVKSAEAFSENCCSVRHIQAHHIAEAVSKAMRLDRMEGYKDIVVREAVAGEILDA